MARSYKLLGSLEIEENGRLSPLMKSNIGCAILSYLIVTGQDHPRAHIADLLWNLPSTSHALHNMRRLLNGVRRDAPELIVTRQTLGFEPHLTTHIDYLQLQAALRQARAAQPDWQQLDEGLQQYRGDLLATFYVDDAPRFNEWLTLSRERLRFQVMAAYQQLCGAYFDAEAWEQGIAAARRWLLLDDLHEETYRWLIQFLLANEQPAEAQRIYETCQERLWEELGVEPDAETQALAAELATTAVSPTPLIVPQTFVVWQPDPLPPPDKVAKLGSLPPGSLLPYQRNEAFTGRKEDLIELGKWLLPWEDTLPQPLLLGGESVSSPLEGTKGGRTIAITGMGGLGKTQLAVEFAHRYGRFYAGGVYWLSFAQAENVAEEVATIGGKRGMRLYEAANKLTLADQVSRVQQAWQATIPRLLIFDSCEDEALLQKWLPVSGGCRVLLTSRRGQWSSGLGVTIHPLTVLTRQASTALLHHLAPQTVAAALEEVEAIAANLGDLPLALHLAGSFLHRYPQTTPAIYMQQLTQVGLLKHPSLQVSGETASPTRYKLNVARTFAVNFEQLDAHDEIDAMAQQLLAHAAYFAPDEPIPTELLLATVDDDADLLAKLLSEDGLTRLLSLGFLQTADRETVIMHRLLVEFAQDHLRMEEAMQTAVVQTVTEAVRRHRQLTNSLYTLPLASTHIHHFLQHTAAKPSGALARLAGHFGFHFIRIADYAAAHRCLAFAFAVDKELYGLNHIFTAGSMVRLAIVTRWVGTFQEAWELLEQGLAIHQKMLKPDDVSLSNILNNIAFFLIIRGAYRQAIPYVEKALAMRQQDKSPNDLPLAMSHDVLGNALLHLEAFTKAQTHLNQALTIREEALPPDHPFLAASQYNIGRLFTQQGDFAQAQRYLEQALATREKVLGKNHLQTTESLCATGELLFAQGQLDQARIYFDEALAIQEIIFAKKQPEMARTLKYLGEMHWAEREPEQARPFYERALDILQETAVPEHPDFPLLRKRLEVLAQ